MMVTQLWDLVFAVSRLLLLFAVLIIGSVSLNELLRFRRMTARRRIVTAVLLLVGWFLIFASYDQVDKMENSLKDLPRPFPTQRH